MDEATKPPGRGGGKPRRGKAARPHEDAPVKASIRLSGKAWRMLGVFTVMSRRDRSDIIEGLIVEHLGRYVVADRGERPRIRLRGDGEDDGGGAEAASPAA